MCHCAGLKRHRVFYGAGFFGFVMFPAGFPVFSKNGQGIIYCP
jgi:hypothetical protein